MLEPAPRKTGAGLLHSPAAAAGCCAGHKCCPCTGMPLGNYICVRSNEDVRTRVCDWAALRSINLEALVTLRHSMQAVRMPPQKTRRRRRHSP